MNRQRLKNSFLGVNERDIINNKIYPMLEEVLSKNAPLSAKERRHKRHEIDKLMDEIIEAFSKNEKDYLEQKGLEFLSIKDDIDQTQLVIDKELIEKNEKIDQIKQLQDMLVHVQKMKNINLQKTINNEIEGYQKELETIENNIIIWENKKDEQNSFFDKNYKSIEEKLNKIKSGEINNNGLTDRIISLIENRINVSGKNNGSKKNNKDVKTKNNSDLYYRYNDLKELFGYDIVTKNSNIFEIENGKRSFKKQDISINNNNNIPSFRKIGGFKKILDEMGIILQQENIVKYSDFLFIYLPDKDLSILIDDQTGTHGFKNSTFIILGDIEKQEQDDLVGAKIQFNDEVSWNNDIISHLQDDRHNNREFYELALTRRGLNTTDKKLIGRYLSNKNEIKEIINKNMLEHNFKTISYSNFAKKHNQEPDNQYRKLKDTVHGLVGIFGLDPRKPSIDIIKEAIFGDEKQALKMEESKVIKTYEDPEIMEKLMILYNLYKNGKFTIGNLGGKNFSLWLKKNKIDLPFTSPITLSVYLGGLIKTRPSYQVALWKRFVNKVEGNTEDLKNKENIEKMEKDFTSGFKNNEFEKGEKNNNKKLETEGSITQIKSIKKNNENENLEKFLKTKNNTIKCLLKIVKNTINNDLLIENKDNEEHVKSKINEALISVYKNHYGKSNSKKLYHFIDHFLFENIEKQIERKLLTKKNKTLIINKFIKENPILKKSRCN